MSDSSALLVLSLVVAFLYPTNAGCALDECDLFPNRPPRPESDAGVVDEITVGYVIVNFNNVHVHCFPHSPGEMMDRAEQTLRASTRGQLEIEPRFIGEVTLNRPYTDSCVDGQVNYEVNYEVDALVDWGDVDKRYYFYPNLTALPGVCDAGGRAEVGGTVGWNYLCLGPTAYQVVAHEVGHLVGLHHASADGDEYGDESCHMGSGSSEFNAPHINELGMLSAAEVQTATGSGDYVIHELLIETGQPMLLRIPIGGNPADDYYLSYLGTRVLPRHFANATVVHRYADLRTDLLATLEDGEVFEDAANGFRVEQVAHNGDTTTVRIVMPNVSQGRANASIAHDATRWTRSGSRTVTCNLPQAPVNPAMITQ